MSYTISEFAKILGVTTDTLRVYEKRGIIKPLKDNKNNYRYFSDLDCRSILMSRWYRSIQVSLRNVEELVNVATKDTIIKTVEDQRHALQEEIDKKNILLNKIIEINNELNNLNTLLYQCTIKRLPGMYRLRQTNRTDLLDNVYTESLIKQWMNCLPHTFYSVRISQEELLNNKEIHDYDWGLAVKEDEMALLDLQVNNKVQYIPPYQCLTSVIITCEDTIMTSIQFMIDYINEHGFRICGDTIGRIILIDNFDNHKQTYLEINIPILSN